MTRRWRHVLHIALALAILLVVIAAGGAVVLASIDTDELKPRIAAAVKRATGRELLLDGPIHLGFSLRPSVQVSDVSFANPPGFSRPMMARLQRLDLQLALLPLLRHRIEIERLVLVGPDLLLESNAEGQTNWAFPTKPRPHANQSADRIGIQDVQIDGGTIAYRDEQSGRHGEFDLTGLLMQAASPDAPLHIAMQARVNGAAFSLDGDVGPVSRLQDPKPGPPWPVRLQLAAGDATLAIDGSVGHVAKGRLYDLHLTGRAPDIAPLAAFLPGTHLPPLRDASVSVHLVDTGKHLELDTGFRVAGLSLTAKGAIADMAHLAGVDIALAAGAADLSLLSAQTGLALPPFRSIQFQTRLADAAGGLRNGLALQDIRFSSTQAEVAGDVEMWFSPRPSLHAKLAAARIDAAALRSTASTTPVAPTLPEIPHWAIPDTTLPFDLLRAFDADVELDIASLRSRRTEYRSIAARLALHDGRLLLAPLTIELPEGRLTGALGADVTQPNPRVDLTLHAPGLAVQPLLTALGLSEQVSGKVRVSLELHGSGNTPHALAAGLNGHLGLAMGRGKFSNWLLGNTVGWALRKAGLAFLATQIGSSELRCFALRLDFIDGVGSLNSLMLDSTPLYLDGSGTIGLGDESVDLRLRPEPMVAGLGVFAPLHLSGTLVHPRVRPDAVGGAQANAGMLVGVVEWIVTPISWMAEMLGVIGPQAPGRDGCIAPLIQARATETELPPLPPTR